MIYAKVKIITRGFECCRERNCTARMIGSRLGGILCLFGCVCDASLSVSTSEGALCTHK